MKTIRNKIEISKNQYLELLKHFKIVGKFQHFPSLFEKLKVENKIVFTKKKSIEIFPGSFLNLFLIKVHKKPKMSFFDGKKHKCLNDGYVLHYWFRKA